MTALEVMLVLCVISFCECIFLEMPNPSLVVTGNGSMCEYWSLRRFDKWVTELQFFWHNLNIFRYTIWMGWMWTITLLVVHMLFNISIFNCRQRPDDDKWAHDLYSANETRVSSMKWETSTCVIISKSYQYLGCSLLLFK